jgi:hypothetical protein
MSKLSGSLAVVGATLEINYRVQNLERELLYVSALVTDAASTPYPGTAYAALSADDLVLNVVLGASTLPTHGRIDFQVTAPATELRPGSDMTGQLRLVLPVREWNAYTLPVYPEACATPVAVRQVALFVDTIRESEVKVAKPTMDLEGYWGYSRVEGKKVERLKLTLTPDAPIPVLRRPGLFPR